MLSQLRGVDSQLLIFVASSALLFLVRHKEIVFPDAASVVLGSSDDSVSLVIEGTRENLITVALQHLQALPGLHGPQATGAIAGSGEELATIGAELHLGDLPLVADQDGHAR